MARSKTYDSNDLLAQALLQFWSHGYHATSMDDLVRVTGVSRHGIYTEFGGKRGLFVACFKQYRASIVDPAFGRVEATHAKLNDIAAYFEHQIALAEQGGLPGPGCFVANAASETAPHDKGIRLLVDAHNTRLLKGFTDALCNSGKSNSSAKELAYALLTFATGLWTMSRVTQDSEKLRTTTKEFLKLLAGTA